MTDGGHHTFPPYNGGDMRANEGDTTRMEDVLLLVVAIFLFIGVKILFAYTLICVITLIGGLL